MNVPTFAAIGLAVAIVITCCRAAAKPAPGPTQGTASWYGYEHLDKPMANGKPFDPTALTCASWHYPLGTRLSVIRTDGSGRSVVVTVTDRGPNRRYPDRIIDLSRAAFGRLGHPRLGLIEVTVQPLRG